MKLTAHTYVVTDFADDGWSITPSMTCRLPAAQRRSSPGYARRGVSLGVAVTSGL